MLFSTSHLACLTGLNEGIFPRVKNLLRRAKNPVVHGGKTPGHEI